ncbi:CinA domain-containing protein [Frankia sp. Hr75.2]|nr:CinA domain-containing protein [Frankia sp. Hr75.2]
MQALRLGEVFVAIAADGDVTVRQHEFDGKRAAIRTAASTAGLSDSSSAQRRAVRGQ